MVVALLALLPLLLPKTKLDPWGQPKCTPLKPEPRLLQRLGQFGRPFQPIVRSWHPA